MGGGHGRLVGRDAELEVVRSAVDALSGGAGGGFLQFVGEPGIGKSRLLTELSDEAERRGHLVLGGRAAELELQLPFGVFVGALDDYLASLDLEGLERLDPAIVGELATVFPALETRSAGMPTAVPDERYRTYRAVRTLLDELARSRPLVVLLDDLHWADPASGELLAHLLAHPPTGSVLVAVAFRPAQIPARLGAALAAAARAGGSARIDLAPLTHRDIFDKLGVSTRAAVAGIVAPASSSAAE